MSTNVNDPSTVYLLDEGLELWLIVIQYTPTPNEALLKLCDNLVPIIGKLNACLSVANVLILPCEFLEPIRSVDICLFVYLLEFSDCLICPSSSNHLHPDAIRIQVFTSF